MVMQSTTIQDNVLGALPSSGARISSIKWYKGLKYNSSVWRPTISGNHIIGVRKKAILIILLIISVISRYRAAIIPTTITTQIVLTSRINKPAIASITIGPGFILNMINKGI